MNDSVMQSINNLLKQTDLADRNSLFQMQCFILNKEPTTQGKLHQCLLELKSRKNSLEAIDLEIEEQKDNVSLIEIEIQKTLKPLSTTIDELDRMELNISIKKAERRKAHTIMHMDKLLQNKKTLEEEALFWLSAFEQLSKREALKQWDDPEVQKEYWNEKLRQEVNLRLLLRQLPDTETLRSVLALHDDSKLKIKTLEMLENYNKQIASQTTKLAAKEEFAI